MALMFVWSFHPTTLDSSSYLLLLMTLIPIWFFCALTIIMLMSFANRISNRQPGRVLGNRILKVVRTYPKQVLASRSTKSVDRLEVIERIISDSERLRVLSVNARLLTVVQDDGRCLLDRILEQRRRVDCLITSPFEVEVISRAKRISGRYIERYLLTFLRLMEIAVLAENNNSTQGLVTLRMQSAIPHYRLFASDKWIHIDPYDELRGVRESHGFTVPKVYTIDDVSKVVAAVYLAMENSGETKDASDLMKSLHRIFDFSLSQPRGKSSLKTIYLKYSNAFDQEWKAAEDKPLKPLSTWNSANLEALCVKLGLAGLPPGDSQDRLSAIQTRYRDLEKTSSELWPWCGREAIPNIRVSSDADDLPADFGPSSN